MREPDHTVGIDDGVVRLDLLAGQIVFGDDHARGAALWPRQCLERIVPNLVLAEIDRRQILRHRLHAGGCTEVAAGIADEPLRILRRAAGIVAGHAVEHLHELVGIVGGGHDAVEIVTADAVEQRLFLGVGPRKACQPFGIGKLFCQISGRPQLDIGGGGAAGGDIRRLRAVEVVTDGANGERIAAGLELGRGEAELAGVVADHGNGQARSVALGAHDDAFHGALRGRADLTGQRGWRLSVRGNDREPDRNHAGGQSKQKISRWHRRLLDVSALNANGKRKRFAQP